MRSVTVEQLLEIVQLRQVLERAAAALCAAYDLTADAATGETTAEGQEVADAVDAAPRPTVMLRMEGAPVQDPAVLDGVRAAAAGADVPEAAVDHGFMYQHGFEDPDGHLWEVMAMDADALPAA